MCFALLLHPCLHVYNWQKWNLTILLLEPGRKAILLTINPEAVNSSSRWINGTGRRFHNHHSWHLSQRQGYVSSSSDPGPGSEQLCVQCPSHWCFASASCRFWRSTGHRSRRSRTTVTWRPRWRWPDRASAGQRWGLVCTRLALLSQISVS